MSSLDGFKQVWAVNWQEFDWGLRDDGYSLHLTQEDAQCYVEKHQSFQFRPGNIFYVAVCQEIFNILKADQENGGLGIEKAFPKRLTPGQKLQYLAGNDSFR